MAWRLYRQKQAVDVRVDLRIFYYCNITNSTTKVSNNNNKSEDKCDEHTHSWKDI